MAVYNASTSWLLLLALSFSSGCVSNRSVASDNTKPVLLESIGNTHISNNTMPTQGISVVKRVDNESFWSKQKYVSVEAGNSLVPSVTVSRDSSDLPMKVVRQGGQNFITVSSKEFKCLENIYLMAFLESKRITAPHEKNDLLFEIYFHGFQPHTDSVFTRNKTLEFFFNSIVKKVAQDSSCLSDNTKSQIILLTKSQLSYVSTAK